MLSTIIFLVLLSIGLVQVMPIVDESCKVQIYDGSTTCSGLIVASRSCNESTANLSKTRFELCDAVDLTWSYPMNNLTIIVETPFTQQHQPYAININNGFFKEYPLGI